MSDTIEMLRKVPMFAELDEDELTWVADLASGFEVLAGFVLIEHGQPGSGMFVITEGTVTRIARVRAKTPVMGLAISRMAFKELLEREPRVAVRMLPVLGRRLAEAETA